MSFIDPNARADSDLSSEDDIKHEQATSSAHPPAGAAIGHVLPAAVDRLWGCVAPEKTEHARIASQAIDELRRGGFSDAAISQAQRVLEVQIRSRSDRLFKEGPVKSSPYLVHKVKRLKATAPIYVMEDCRQLGNPQAVTVWVYKFEAEIGALAAIMATTADRKMPQFIMDVLNERGQAHLVNWAARPNEHAAQLGRLHQHGESGYGECRPTTIHVLAGRSIPGMIKDIEYDPRQPWENGFEFTEAAELWLIKPFKDAIIRRVKTYDPEQRKVLHAFTTAKEISDFKKTYKTS